MIQIVVMDKENGLVLALKPRERRGKLLSICGSNTERSPKVQSEQQKYTHSRTLTLGKTLNRGFELLYQITGKASIDGKPGLKVPGNTRSLSCLHLNDGRKSGGDRKKSVRIMRLSKLHSDRRFVLKLTETLLGPLSGLKPKETVKSRPLSDVERLALDFQSSRKRRANGGTSLPNSPPILSPGTPGKRYFIALSRCGSPLKVPKLAGLPLISARSFGGVAEAFSRRRAGL